MVCFQTKNSNLGKFWRALEWKVLLYFMINWEYFMAIWHNVHMAVCGHLVYFPHFGMFGPRKIWQPWSGYGLSDFFTNTSGHPDRIILSLR
jgi:hypothetical protein